MIIYTVARVINLFADIIVTLICIEAVMSWFTPSFGQQLWKIYGTIHRVTNPFVEPFRRLMWRFTSQFGIDFSPIVAILAIQFVARIITRLLIAIL